MSFLRRRTPPPLPVAVGLALVAAAVVTCGIYVGISWLAHGSWRPSGRPQEPDQAGLIRLAMTATAGAGAVIALVIAYRRQHSAELDTSDAARQLGEAAAQLGSATAVARLAGAYGIAAIADREPRLRQQSAKVLCAALRLAPEDVTETDDEVRRLIGEIICERLRLDHHATWTHDISLANARLVDFTLTSARIGARLDFGGATFIGRTVLDGTKFEAPVRLDSAIFDDELSCRAARFDGDLDAAGCTFRSDANFTSTVVDSFLTVIESQVEGSLWLRSMKVQHLVASQVAVAGALLMNSARVEGNVDLRDTRCAGTLSLEDAELGGNLTLTGLVVGDVWTLEGLRTRKRAELQGVKPAEFAAELGRVLGPRGEG